MFSVKLKSVLYVTLRKHSRSCWHLLSSYANLLIKLLYVLYMSPYESILHHVGICLSIPNDECKRAGQNIASLRKQAIKSHNIDTQLSEQPLCLGCKGFFAKKYNPRHLLVCSAAGNNLMLPLVNIASCQNIETLPADFKELLNLAWNPLKNVNVNRGNVVGKCSPRKILQFCTF